MTPATGFGCRPLKGTTCWDITLQTPSAGAPNRSPDCPDADPTAKRASNDHGSRHRRHLCGVRSHPPSHRHRRRRLHSTLHRRTPRHLSFSAALQAIAASWQVLAVSGEAFAARLVEIELENLAAHVVGRRPGRVEPRAVKRRPKPHDLLTKPRNQARAELLGTAWS